MPRRPSGPRGDVELERYLARRRKFAPARADWEEDAAFMSLALTLWPADCEGAALGRDSNRARMRLRYQGYSALSGAKRQVRALHRAAEQALSNWGKKVQ